MSPWLSERLLRTQADERLAALAAEGHEEAFAALVGRYRQPLLAFARGLGVGARAEDVVQQALMGAWLALRGGTEVGHVRGWLYQATRRAAWRAAGASETEELPGTLGAVADTEGEAERRLEVRRLLAEMQMLPERQRDALVAVALEGRAGPEIADELGVTPNGLRQLVFRARTALRTATGALLPVPLVTWAAGRSASSSPLNERLAGLLGSGGAAGSTVGLTKVAAVVAVAGAVAGGVVVRHAVDGTTVPGPGVAVPARHASAAAQRTTIGKARPAPRRAGPPEPSRGARRHRARRGRASAPVRSVAPEATPVAATIPPSVPSEGAGGAKPPAGPLPDAGGGSTGARQVGAAAPAPVPAAPSRSLAEEDGKQAPAAVSETSSDSTSPESSDSKSSEAAEATSAEGPDSTTSEGSTGAAEGAESNPAEDPGSSSGAASEGEDTPSSGEAGEDG